MNILLLGCTGFIGKELIPKLIKEGHNIIIVSRKNIDKLDIKIPINKYKFLKLDLSKKNNPSGFVKTDSTIGIIHFL